MLFTFDQCESSILKLTETFIGQFEGLKVKKIVKCKIILGTFHI